MLKRESREGSNCNWRRSGDSSTSQVIVNGVNPTVVRSREVQGRERARETVSAAKLPWPLPTFWRVAAWN
jgi:hypothetical protein